MMTDLASAVLDRMGGDDGWLLGTVKAIDAGTNSLTVTLPSGDLSGLRWITSYTPVIGDLVAVSRISGAWFVIGKTSAVMTPDTARTWSVSPSLWQASKFGSGSWVWQPYLCDQGYWSAADTRYGGYALSDGRFADAIPSGATVQSAKLSMMRDTRAGYFDGGEGPALVSPVIYGTDGNKAGAPSLAAGYGPWRPGKLTYGETGTWDLPSTWLTALRAGTIAGLAFYSTSATDLASWFSVSYSGTYTL